MPQIVCLVVVVAAATSCDTPAEPLAREAATSRPADARRIPLVAIPFTVVAPDGWDVRAGPGGALALNGRTPDGSEIDVAVAAREPVRADALAPMLAERPPTTQGGVAADAGALVRRVEHRDGLTIIDEAARAGADDLPADVAPYRWTLRCIVLGDGLEYPSYELDLTGLTQVIYERNRAFLAAILASLQYDASAATGGR